MTSIFMSLMIWNAGGTYFDKDFHLTFNNSGTVKALTFLKTMAQYSPPGIGSYSYSDMINGYLAGKVAQDIYAPRLAANAAANTPDIFKNTSADSHPDGAERRGGQIRQCQQFCARFRKGGSQKYRRRPQIPEVRDDRRAFRAFSLTAFPHLIPPLKSVQPEVITKGSANLNGREEISRIAFDTSNSLDFDSEAGAKFEDGKVVRTGEVNRLIGSIVARNIPAEVLQRVVLQGEDPAAAAAWGQEQCSRSSTT